MSNSPDDRATRARPTSKPPPIGGTSKSCVLTPLAAKDAQGPRWGHDGRIMEPLDALRAFRRSFYGCLHRRANALFELTDAILTADAVPSPVHLSLQGSYRRGWGSFYTALDRGRIDAEALRDLLARHPLAGSDPPVYAVDVSVWARCDAAETSPERGFYYHPSRHSAGQPIVAGWAYQFVAGLTFVRESWTAPVDVRRVRPAQDANEVAAEQIEAFLDRGVPRPISDGGRRPPVRLRCGLRPRKVAASAGGEPVPGARPPAGGASLLRRPRPLCELSARSPPTPGAPVATGRR